MNQDLATLQQRLAALEAQAAGLGNAQVMTRDFGGEIRFWSHGMQRLYGYTAGEAIGGYRMICCAPNSPYRSATSNASFSSAESGPANCITADGTGRKSSSSATSRCCAATPRW
jgi:hypothetical protein